MKADPAELIFYQEMTTDRFFEEAKQQGISIEELSDEETHNQLFYSCLVQLRAETAKAVAGHLSIPITDDQAVSIARNSLVPEVSEDPVPLTSEERRIATELYYHAIRAAASRHGMSMKEKAARSGARQMVTTGEKGLTGLQKLSRAVGCLVVLGMLTFGSALTLLVFTMALMAVRSSS